MNIAVAQSGGPTSAINASLLGVIKAALNSKEIETVFGAFYGIEGVINDNFVNLNEIFENEYNRQLLKQTPSTYLGSCRYKLPDFEKQPQVYEVIANRFKEKDIGAFFYIGGNDSMDTANKLSKYFKEIGSDIKVIGVPKTIDNDLNCTDHTPGFGSAAKYLTVCLQEITRDASVYDMKSVVIVETMGRNAGWLAASSCVLHKCGNKAPHLIYLPEVEFSVERFVNDVKQQLAKNDTVIVVVSEGVEIEGSTYMSENPDEFGHGFLSGGGKFLENIVKKEIGCKVRSIELSVLQRCSAFMSSLTDITEAEQLGSAAVEEALKGNTGVMMCFKRISNSPYKVEITTTPAGEVANFEKKVPTEWINKEKNNVKDIAIEYFLPLISGEQEFITENGIPKHIIANN